MLSKYTDGCVGACMMEIEGKIININKQEIEKRLISLGATKIFEGEVYSLYFDYPDRVLKKHGKTLRLRKIGREIILTLKTSGEPGDQESNLKIRNEYEVKLSDFENTKKILENIGLSIWLELKKHRTSYILDTVRFEIDKYQGEYSYIPQLLEIEGPNMETIYKYVELLGFNKKDCKPWTFEDLIYHFSHSKV